MNPKKHFPSVSVIINTDGRANSLATCLDSLRYLRYPNFEVVVGAGPTRDGTHELCESYGDSIKYALCPERNLSQSRNISIAISAGEFVAFLDDDSVPEPEWLNDVMPAFEDPDVAVAGGFLHDHTGKTYQWTFGTVDRFGGADTSWKTAAPHLNFPGSFHYPHVMANSVFRRSAVAEVGGFDEEYEYFLDESDLIVRFVDAGFKVAQLDKGFVHHKYMPSHIRNESKVLTSWYSVIKNKTYFSLLNGKDHATVDEVVAVVRGMIEEFRGNVRWAIGENKLAPEYSARFEDEVDRAFKRGLQRGLEGVRRIPGSAPMLGVPGLTRFVPWLEADEQRCYVFVSKSYPPESVGGVGRYIHQLATEVARLGHQVHVLTAGADHDRVDFEEGVWVHRICERASAVPAGMDIPRHLWNFSHTMYEEAREIASRRRVDAVYAPVWDVEGIAFLVAKTFPLITSLQTTMASYLDANEEKRRDTTFLRTFAKPVLALEKRLMVESDRIHAISHAIVGEIERQYDFRFDPARVDMIPLGLADWSSLHADAPAPLAEGAVRLCFIGRMEFRKGADVFLSLVEQLLQAYPQLHIDIVGNDRITLADGSTMRANFEKQHAALMRGGRVVFHGAVSDERLRGFYAAADLVVAPSRFESFGLVHLEGMMFGKPVIGCAIGGMQEVIADGATGLLVPPGDAAALRAAIGRLVEDAGLRVRLGQAGRARYLDRFQPRQMAEGVVAAFRQLSTH
jgi:glycosyltransferase involved in cell wall biosynthesis/GT2 family glycosyltransferase